MKTIEAVIVTWNSGATIEACLRSCESLAVTVVDNASSDDTIHKVRRYPNVYLIANTDNRGFAAAANQGIARSGADYVLLLNPDVELRTAIDGLCEACSDPEVSMAAGKLVDANGSPQTGFNVRRLPAPLTLAYEALGLNRLLPRNPVNRRYRCLDLNLDQAADVEQPAGAFLMFRRDLWESVGGFDERFSPVWFEDVDFAKRALERGRIRFIPDVIAAHRGGASIHRMDWPHRELCWYVSLLRYVSKHYSSSKFRGVCGAVVLGSGLRCLAGIFQGRLSKAIKVYAKIAGLATQCLFLGRIGPVSVEGIQQGIRVRTTTGSTK